MKSFKKTLKKWKILIFAEKIINKNLKVPENEKK